MTPHSFARIEPADGHCLELGLTPFPGAVHRFLFPESVGMSVRLPDASPAAHSWHCWGAQTLLRYSRPLTGRFALMHHGWWERTEETPDCRCTARLKPQDDQLRLDLEVEITNKSSLDWIAAGINPCLGLLPSVWQDPGLRRMHVVDAQGHLRILGDLVAGNNCNVISMQAGPLIERDETMLTLPEWLMQDLRIKEPLMMSQSADLQFTLVFAFETACSLATGYGGPCMHVISRTGPLPAGATAILRGMISLLNGDAALGLQYYSRWKNQFS